MSRRKAISLAVRPSTMQRSSSSSRGLSETVGNTGRVRRARSFTTLAAMWGDMGDPPWEASRMAAAISSGRAVFKR